MKTQWTLLATRIDALTLRERAILFLSVLAVCGALAYQFVFEPARLRHLALSQQFSAETAELQRLRDEVRQLVANDPGAPLRAELAQVKADTTSTQAAVAELTGASDAATSLPQVLVHFLRRQPGLKLLRTTSLAPEAVNGPADAAAAGAAANVAERAVVTPARGPLPAGLVRQGLELRVAGTFAELVQYVQTLEKSLPQLRWGALTLDSTRQPPQLELRVFIVGPPP